MGYRALHDCESEDGTVFTVLVIEGAANDVAAYVIGGEHDEWEYVLKHGTKMTEREARKEVGWPSRLTYRR